MYYIDHTEGNLIGVADTKDGVIDLLTREQVQQCKNEGLQILTWNDAKGQITASLNRNCNYHLYKKLERNCSDNDLLEYLQKYSVYTFVNETYKSGTQLDLNGCCRLFDYSQTKGFFIIVLGLSDGSKLFGRIDGNSYQLVCETLKINAKFNVYPAIGGSFVRRLALKQGIEINEPNFYDNMAYAVLYDSNFTKVYLVCLDSFNIITKNIKGVLQ